MKKYPFSQKALKAMLAATIALSPVVSSAVFEPSKVEATTTSTYTVDSLIAELDRIYDLIELEDKKYLATKGAEYKNLPWNTYASDILKDTPDAPTQAELDLMAALLQLFASTTDVASLKENIGNFREEQADRVDDVFNMDVTVDEVLLFVAAIEGKFLDSLSGSESTGTDFFNNLQLALASVLLVPEAGYSDVATKFKDMVDIEGASSVFATISSIIDNESKEILIKAVKDATTQSGGGGIGGGGAAPTPAPTEPNVITLPAGAAEVVKEKNPSGQVEVVTKVDSKKVAEIVNLITAEKNTIGITLEKPAAGEAVKAQVPASLFTEALKKNTNAVVQVSTEGASYKLPASELKVADLAKKLGVAEGDVQINISVNVVPATDVKGNVDKNKLTLASNVIEFTVEAVSGDKKESVTTFSTYVERDIVGSKDFNSKNSVAVKLNDDGTITAIPTVFDGKVATVKSLTNSKYTIVENNKTFTDVGSKSWAKPYIDTLASKYIVFGKTDEKYDPSANMTRAEFAAILVRALGLPTSEKYDGSFKDVKGTEWFAKDGGLTAAVNFGLVHGVTEDKFAPGANITRAQAAVMIHRAMEIDFIDYDESQLNKSKKLADFSDNKQIGSTAKAGVEAVYQAGIFDGKEDGFDPNGYTKRHEMAKVLASFLVSADLMNKIN